MKLRFSPLRNKWPYTILSILFRPFGFIAPKTLNYLAFQYVDIEFCLWRLFQKHVVRTKFNIYTIL